MAGSFSRRLHQALFGSDIQRQEIYPAVDAAGTGVALGAAGNSPAWGAWVDVALPALITVENLVRGFTIDTHSAACIATVDIGSTRSLGVLYANAAAVIAAGAPAIAGAHRAIFRAQLIAIAAGQGYVVMLPSPVLINTGEGILARWQTAAGAETGNITIMAVLNS